MAALNIIVAIPGLFRLPLPSCTDGIGSGPSVIIAMEASAYDRLRRYLESLFIAQLCLFFAREVVAIELQKLSIALLINSHYVTPTPLCIFTLT